MYELGLAALPASFAPSTLTTSLLQNQDVLIVVNSWGQFTDSEIAAIQGFINNGGRLLLAGLGWSWEPYNLGKTIQDHPINKIGAIFGVRWITPVIADPSDNYQGSPIFHTFCPTIR